MPKKDYLKVTLPWFGGYFFVARIIKNIKLTSILNKYNLTTTFKYCII